MDVVKISLEALLQRAANPQNEEIDRAAVEAFCALVSKEKEGPLIAVKLLAVCIHSKAEQEALYTLEIIDYALKKCGVLFQSEIGKFRFLNEMIKLVSPKYMGCVTPLSVKQKVLQYMYLWTIDYPKESKIKEAYQMLKKQGVIKEAQLDCGDEDEQNNLESRIRNNLTNNIGSCKKQTVFQDEEKGKLLKRLLQSKNPEDLQAANRLIKSMVKEDERKAEIKSKKLMQLETVHNNVKLLKEMLDSYKPGATSQDELDLINELHEACEGLRPIIVQLAHDTHESDPILRDILFANDELGRAYYKYVTTIEKPPDGKEADSNQLSLLDLNGQPSNNLSLNVKEEAKIKSYSDLDELCDILNTPNTIGNTSSTDTEDFILKPTAANISLETNGDLERSSNKLKALEELDALGEHLLKENLQSTGRLGPHFKSQEKVPMNLLPKTNVCDKFEKSKINELVNYDLTSLDLPKPSTEAIENKYDPNGDDLLVDITEEAFDTKSSPVKTEENQSIIKPELKLSDITIELKDIKPSNIKPVTAMEEKNGVSVTLHFSKESPHEDVTVIVVTIASKNELPLKNILFRAIVPKVCKVKLQTPSACDLPPYNPFVPPAPITQIMLIANPEKVQVSLKFIVSYNIEDETMTEMGEIDELPVVS